MFQKVYWILSYLYYKKMFDLADKSKRGLVFIRVYSLFFYYNVFLCLIKDYGFIIEWFILSRFKYLKFYSVRFF